LISVKRVKRQVIAEDLRVALGRFGIDQILYSVVVANHITIMAHAVGSRAESERSEYRRAYSDWSRSPVGAASGQAPPPFPAAWLSTVRCDVSDDKGTIYSPVSARTGGSDPWSQIRRFRPTPTEGARQLFIGWAVEGEIVQRQGINLQHVP
jgi:hypothetical protein